MIGVWSEHAATYLLVLGIVTALVFATPLFLVPLRWARVFGWSLPGDTDLAVYFGRCLGGLALAVDALVLRGALTGVGVAFAFQVLILAGVMMVIAHAWGALARIQPLSETLEIGFWALLVILSLLFYPV